jgi:hypothetical protein
MTPHFILRAPLVTWVKLGQSSNYFALPLGQKSIGANLQPYELTRKKRNGVRTRSQAEMDFRGTRRSIFRHPNRLPATHWGQFWKNHAHLKKKDDHLGQVQPLSCWQNFGCQPSIVFLNVVLGGLLEPQSKDVQPDQRSGMKLHLGKGLQHMGKGQMGFSYTPLV